MVAQNMLRTYDVEKVFDEIFSNFTTLYCKHQYTIFVIKKNNINHDDSWEVLFGS